MDFKDTLLMPKTEFAMRGNLGVREPLIQARWKEIDLYKKILEQNKDNTPFILHDGPPYANGNIHMGHAFQKTLKDFALRYQSMMGKYVPYIPGWDTHGLPIENAVTKMGINRKELSRAEFRKICRSFALEQVAKQKDQFMRLGILGEWDHPYLTLDKTFIADQTRIFGKMVEKGLIYKGLKPIYWSPSSESALAEAEIEYQDKESKSIYVGFRVIDKVFKDTDLLIWTTTPWTLPANLAVSVHPKLTYLHVSVDGKTYIIGKNLLETLTKALHWTDVKVLKELRGKDLEKLKYQHPFLDRIGMVILGEHVTDTDGTGLVHTAPGHGEDDYIVGKKYHLDILCPVDDKGMMTSEAGIYEGMFYEKANDKIVEDLKASGHLLKSSIIKHSYPHDWRTHKPVIFRATPQWFASVAKIKKELLAATEHVSWLPKWGELRLSNMLKDREDWVISRQRVWGVPIPIFYDENNEAVLDPKLIDHIADLFEVHGSDIWYEWEIKDLLPKDYPVYPKKEVDILDVWFDSGTSYSVLKRRGLPYPADLYLEGSDQYRGWFNSSLITSVAAFGTSPYKNVVSHGFILDGEGRKMSKSLGNVIDPLKIIDQNGADLLRLWVATVYYQADVRISNNLMTQVSETYRKLRNTLRFLLGNLDDFNPNTDYYGWSMRGNLNRVVTLRFHRMVKDVLSSYEAYEFDKVLKTIVPYVVNELSAFYLDYTKDILYIEDKNDPERRSVQSTLYDITLGLLKILTPIIPHTTSEAYQTMPYKAFEDIYLSGMPAVGRTEFEGYHEAFDVFGEFRTQVLKQLEVAREEKVIGKSLQAHVHAMIDEKTHTALKTLDVLSNLHQILIVSSVKLEIGKEISIAISKAEGHECARCWNVVTSVNDAHICSRCAKVVAKKGR